MTNFGLKGTVKRVSPEEFEQKRTDGPDAAEMLVLASGGQYFEVTYKDDAIAKKEHGYLLNLRTRAGLTDRVAVTKRGLRILIGPREASDE